MPELPEVETIARKLRIALQYHRFTDITVLWAKTIANMNPSEFTQCMHETTVYDIWRRGKYIVIKLDNGKELVIHLRMSGRFALHPSNEDQGANNHTRVRMRLDNGMVLSYIDQRKFGRFYLVDDADTITRKLGPEPLSLQFSTDWLVDALSKRNAQIKTLLLNQQFVAGLGNIYVNEALWKARIHPFCIAKTLTYREVSNLHEAIREVLQHAINQGGTSLDDRQYTYPDGQLGAYQQHLHVYNRAGEQCERCGIMLERIVQAQRSTYYCPNCQSANRDAAYAPTTRSNSNQVS